METDKKHYNKEFDYFLDRINIAQSALDARAIQFLNTSNILIKNDYVNKHCLTSLHSAIVDSVMKGLLNCKYYIIFDDQVERIHKIVSEEVKQTLLAKGFDDEVV